MTTERRLLLLLAFLGVVVWSATYLASGAKDSKKQPYALIFGTVYAADNRPAYGVTVRIRRADQKKAKWELISDHQGEFAQRVPPGPADYIVWTETKKGPKTEVKVHVEKDERVDVGLHLRE